MVVSFQRLGFICCLLLPVQLLAAESVFEKEWNLARYEIAKVKAGKLVIHAKSIGDGYIKEVEGFLMIDAPAADILTLVTDYEQLPEFMPRLDYTEVLFEDEKGATVNYYLDLPFGVHKQYRLRLDYDTTPPDLQMAWHKIEWEGLKPEQTLADTQGYWMLRQVSESKTLLHYYTRTDPGHVPFGLGWMVDMMTKKTVVELLKNTKHRVEEQWANKHNSD